MPAGFSSAIVRAAFSRVSRDSLLDPADRPAELVGGDLGGDLRLAAEPSCA